MDSSQELSAQLPKLWVGFLIAIVLLITEIVVGLLDPTGVTDTEQPNLLFVIIGVAGWVYWLYCVSQYHTVLRQVPGWHHPITPGRAIGFHFIPFYNIYWVFKWPNEIATFVNIRLSANRMVGGWAGGLILVGSFLGRLFDTAIGLAVIFSAGLYISRRLREALAAPLESQAAV